MTGRPGRGFVVRDGAAEDRVGIRRLLRELHGDVAESMTLPVVRQEARTFVAVDGLELAGVVVGTFVDYGREPYGTIEELVVAPGWRGAGIGTALLDECRGWLAGTGAEVVFVSAVGDAAAEFYLRAGFVRCVGSWLWGGTAVGRE
ncbi:GNAT superfamily N-acetyltransferase [Kribbella aluminosa]|uniref:GNAT superfamily N-acetyltransferase n=1 Tax=Kribbella aluminosa TaxID=416017 RepID=A0ABS4UZV2_9ACTN|nr:GNAT family N-acetyltransferase [Kribbella aluminosa]MBP2357185.1 GNAT superfamily N-acetyltransferase [Kribbella aluminosa]